MELRERIADIVDDVKLDIRHPYNKTVNAAADAILAAVREVVPSVFARPEVDWEIGYNAAIYTILDKLKDSPNGL